MRGRDQNAARRQQKIMPRIRARASCLYPPTPQGKIGMNETQPTACATSDRAAPLGCHTHGPIVEVHASHCCTVGYLPAAVDRTPIAQPTALCHHYCAEVLLRCSRSPSNYLALRTFVS